MVERLFQTCSPRRVSVLIRGVAGVAFYTFLALTFYVFISSVVGISWQNWRSRSRRPPRERCECVVQIKFYHLFRSLVGFVDLLFLRLDGENLISKIGNLLVVPHKGYRWKLLWTISLKRKLCMCDLANCIRTPSSLSLTCQIFVRSWTGRDTIYIRTAQGKEKSRVKSLISDFFLVYWNKLYFFIFN